MRKQHNTYDGKEGIMIQFININQSYRFRLLLLIAFECEIIEVLFRILFLASIINHIGINKYKGKKRKDISFMEVEYEKNVMALSQQCFYVLFTKEIMLYILFISIIFCQM